MRHLLLALAAMSVMAGCATTENKPAAAAQPTAQAKPAEPAKAAAAPRCYSGDSGKFHNVGEQTQIAGVAVTCSASSDGKAAVWTTAKHGK